jgi:hypothetical protein
MGGEGFSLLPIDGLYPEGVVGHKKGKRDIQTPF